MLFYLGRHLAPLQVIKNLGDGFWPYLVAGFIFFLSSEPPARVMLQQENDGSIYELLQAPWGSRHFPYNPQGFPDEHQTSTAPSYTQTPKLASAAQRGAPNTPLRSASGCFVPQAQCGHRD